MTPQEAKLWVHLRQWRTLGIHFRRQVPRLNYIVDFACLKARLIVELDGEPHGFHANAVRDAERDHRLTYRSGFRVMRFWNSDIDRNLDGVLDLILAACAERLPSPPTTRSLSSGRPLAGPGGAVPPPRSGEG
jgi:very-short-patch-repair endonuclease